MARNLHDAWLPRRPLARAALPALCLCAIALGCDLDERTLTFSVGEPIAPSSSGSGGSGADSSSGDQAGASATENGAAAGAPSSAGEASAGTSTGGANTGGLHGEPNGGSGAGGSANAGTASGGSETGGMPNGGTPNGGGGGGAAGVAGSGGAPFVSPCGDLNQNRVDDCEETLVKNSRFDADVGSWDAELQLQQHWEAVNATGGSASGALSITNVNVLPNLGGSTTVGSRQCMRAWAGQRFAVGARVFVKPGQGSGAAGVNLLIFSGDNCTDDVITGKTIDTVADAGVWHVIEGEVTLPAAARSMYVRLIAEKPFTQASLEALFDDVLVSEKK